MEVSSTAEALDRWEVLCDFVDFLAPSLTPYEASTYLFLLRRSLVHEGPFRIGKRTIAAEMGQGVRAGRANYQHVTKMVTELEAKGCLTIGDTTREGTLYEVVEPMQVPSAQERKAALAPLPDGDPDHFTDPDLRRKLFERDDWRCRYCGETVTESNATLDHVIPQCSGGSNAETNLATACLMCNSIKSGRTYEEAAPDILESIRRRK